MLFCYIFEPSLTLKPNTMELKKEDFTVLVFIILAILICFTDKIWSI